MTLTRSILFLHVLSAVALVATSLLAPVMRQAILGAESPFALRRWVGYARTSARACVVAGGVVLASGVYLARGRWAEAWLVAAAILFGVNTVLALGMMDAAGVRPARLTAARVGPVCPSVERLRRSRRSERAGDAVLANDVALLFLMVVQPKLSLALAAIALSSASALAAVALRRRSVSARRPERKAAVARAS
jgi:hypothetical protein